MRVARTFAFVDLSGFTQFTDLHGDDEAVAVLSQFRAALRATASDIGVRVAKWLGDGAMLVSVDTASLVEAFCGGLGTAAFLAVLMRACEQRQAATRFALLTAISGLARTIGGTISGYGAGSLGYAGWFAVSFALAIPGLLLVPSLVRRIPDR